MKKRIAYIGISYPLLYDFGHAAKRTRNDLISSPNPIIESPWGLMIMYDELIFLCRSICPNNMRNLPYVKFVDELFPQFYFKGALDLANVSEKNIKINSEIKFENIVNAMNLQNGGLDIHTHALKIGDVELYAKSEKYLFLFDLYVFQALQQTYNMDIELVANSKFKLGTANGGVGAEFVEKIIIPNIPNYLGTNGPYHECIEELRENSYIEDFRRWIVEQHTNLQYVEIQEMSQAVNRNIDETLQKTYIKHLEDNSRFSFFKSTSTTMIKTGLGIATEGGVNLAISIVDALGGIVFKGRDVLDTQSARWQGFVVASRSTLKQLN